MWSTQQESVDSGISKADGGLGLLIAATEIESENPAKHTPGDSEENGATALRKNGRDRSMSAPCRPTNSISTSTEVETVVTKAKRASSFLWMLLHSQNCRLGADRCTHAGCAEAKLIHLHLKTCPAHNEFPCPSRTEGCLQARKLLAHYRRCRNIRARQRNQGPGSKTSHVCLICSMVARQARSLLDSNNISCKTTSSNGVIAHKKSGGSKLFSSLNFKAKIKPTPVSASVQGGDWGMPPPAPRRASRSAPASPTDDGLSGNDEPDLQSCSASPVPVVRKRSESCGNELISGRQRGVSFAANDKLLNDDTDESLVAVELASISEAGDDSNAPRRIRSASCHVLSSPKAKEKNKCGTIYEEGAPVSTSFMDE